MFTRLIPVAAMIAAIALPAHAATTLNYIGQQIIPTGEQAFGTTIGGLSGLDYSVANDRYVAISDDRSQVNPARFVVFDQLQGFL